MLKSAILHIGDNSPEGCFVPVVFDESNIKLIEDYFCCSDCKSCKHYARNRDVDTLVTKFGLCNIPPLKINFDYGKT